MNSRFRVLKVVFFSCLILLQLIFSDMVYSQDSLSDQNQEENKEENPALKTIPKSVGQFPIPDIIKVSDTILQIGDITINREDRFISIKGEINMAEGLVEYLACTPKGKIHESVLTLQAEPYYLQVALLLLGLVPGDMPIEFQGAPQPPCGDPVTLSISWKENEKTMEYPPEHLVTNIKDKKIMEKADWVFAGSKILDGQYMAQAEGSLAAIYHDPFAIIDHRSITGADDTLFYANKKVLPPVGTPVVVKIFVNADPAVQKRVKCKNSNQ
ncbi:MAG: YdjY domain-containing protein [Desulfobacula sp.]|jgi:hypothetical protein|nr:YdjY domain-containing protein [Desulfobacula sp.]